MRIGSSERQDRHTTAHPSFRPGAVFALCLSLCGLPAAQTLEEGPQDGSFVVRGTPCSPADIEVEASWDEPHRNRVQAAVGARTWDYASAGLGDTDAGKRAWPRLLAEMAKVRTDTAALTTLIENAGQCCIDNTNTGSFYKPFSCPGYCLYFLEYQDLLPQRQLDTIEARWFRNGRDQCSRIDHHMDPIYDLTEYNSENFNWMGRLGGWLMSHELDDTEPLRGTTAQAYFDGYVENWVRSLFNAGRVEWGSDVYTGYCINPVLVLHEHAHEQAVRLQARAAIDWLLLEAAIRHVDGFGAGPGTRQKGNEHKPFNGSSWFYEWIWFPDHTSSPSFTTEQALAEIPNQMVGFPPYSSYRPPRIIVDIAHRRFATPIEMHNAKPYVHLDNDNYADWRGATDNGRKFEFETMYIERNYTLGSVASYRPAAKATCTNGTPWIEQGLWRLAVRQSSGGAIRITGSAGELSGGGYGNGRCPYEQIGQYRNVMMRLLKGADNMWIMVPNTVSLTWHGDTAFGDAGSGVYVAFIPYHTTGHASDAFEAGYTKHTWSYDSGELGGLVLEMGTAEEHGSFGGFTNAIRSNLGTLSSPAADQLQYTSTSTHGGTIRMEITPTTTYTCVAGNTIDPAGNVPKVWGDELLFDFQSWQSYHVVYGERIVEQNWGSGALSIAASGKGLQIVVDPSSAQVQYRRFEGALGVADGASSPGRGVRPSQPFAYARAATATNRAGNCGRLVDCSGRRVVSRLYDSATQRSPSTGVYFVKSASAPLRRVLFIR